jgi:hypothetical protein
MGGKMIIICGKCGYARVKRINKKCPKCNEGE